ncbi:beta-aspartyl-peptidase [Alkalihalobacillus macyae]|uniref:beta-aspartyl-peptidase n=1 Tax=Guptibacillus hwajinpoensis TaxID=208199 RepID=UPI00273C54DC|nr:beta-aspartyl-peptidase [Alkalihalobacillus macyae]MDP4551106.1 beta-aspartyl-peptidase [Alkalihalobacillus macyae]
MLKVIKNTNVYAPEFLGKKDVLIAGDRIVTIENSINLSGVDFDVIEGENTSCVPGLIDRHVHITGGGGEGGFSSSTPEVQLGTLVQSGITTVVGLLGTNDIGRNTKNLLSKAKALREEGMNAYMLTGGYGYPSNTITGDLREDILFFEEVLGLKLAIEDHRSSYVTNEELKRIASYTRVASMLAKKKGFVHLHMGSGKNHYDQIYTVLEETDFPISLFSPTHINRTESLLEASVEFGLRGGLLDITTNTNTRTKDGTMTPAQALMYLLEKGVSIENITMSSDANGSLPSFDHEGQLNGLEVAGFEPTLQALKDLVQGEHLPLEEALKPFTSNPAKGLGVGSDRGALLEGNYADFLLLDGDLNIRDVYINGVAFMERYELTKTGVFETPFSGISK